MNRQALNNAKVPRVVLVDQNPITQRMIRSEIESRGWHCNLASSSADALRLINLDQAPSLVLIHLWLSDIGAREVARIMSESSEINGVPFVVFTGKPDLEEILEHLQNDCDLSSKN